MEPVKLKTFYDLLLEGKTVAQLATAAETHGVIGWDRFGRFGHFGPLPKAEAVGAALDALADYFRYEEQFYEEKAAESEADGTSAIEALESFPGAAIHRFGWKEEQVPEMPVMPIVPIPSRNRRPSIGPSPQLNVLGALLLHLSDLRREGKAMRIPSEDQLIGDMEAKFPQVQWVKRSTIQYNFADAKKAVDQAKRAP